MPVQIPGVLKDKLIQMHSATGHFLQPYLASYAGWLYVSSWWWTVIGFAGNFLFGSRFIVQWLVSEKRHELVVPEFFWHLSFWGSVLNLLYVLHLDNAPLFFGVVVLPFIYGRNLILLRRQTRPREQICKAEPRAEVASARY
jgi:lipid-A-disaccharide synthase-like uncharacterized protein